MIDQIMAAETARRATPLANRATALSQRRDAWNSFSGLVSKLKDSATALRDGSAFGAFQVTAPKSPTSGLALLSATASTAAVPATYGVEVRSLATREKLRSSAVANSSSALGYSGTFTVNGSAVTVSASDSLVAVRDKINALDSGTASTGVTASIVDVSPTEHYLTLTADDSGAGGIQLTDAGGVLGQLGVSTGSRSAALSSDSTSIAQLLGLPSPPAVRTIVIDGAEVTVDLQNDTLQSLMNKVAAAGHNATVVTGTDGSGATTYSLQVDGDVWGKTDDADTQAALGALGFTRSNQIAAGSDARLRIDGLDVVRSTNTISDAVAGLTLNLQNAEVGTTVQLDVARDDQAAVDRLKEFQSAYNAVIDFRDQQRKTGAPLYADASFGAMLRPIRDVLLDSVPGLDTTATPYYRSGSVGLALNKNGKLDLDTTKLESALASNFSDVRALFGTAGVASGAGFSFVGGTTSSTAGVYDVTITQAATAASQSFAFSGPYADTGSNANTLTLTDGYTGKSGSLTFLPGDDVNSVVSRLNQLFSDQGMTLAASTDGTNLTIAAGKYGSTASFDVSYSRVVGGTTTASGLASPIGFAAGSYAGTDVQGRIDLPGGTAATVTGVGQILTGADGTPAAGISVSYTGTGPATGSLSYTEGIAGQIERMAAEFSRASDGAIASHVSQIDESIGTLQHRQDDVQARLDRYQESLVKQYTAMETALSLLQSQASWLTSQITNMQKA
jgi:flagellar hook-associated protein 2